MILTSTRVPISPSIPSLASAWSNYLAQHTNRNNMSKPNVTLSVPFPATHSKNLTKVSLNIKSPDPTLNKYLCDYLVYNTSDPWGNPHPAATTGGSIKTCQQ